MSDVLYSIGWYSMSIWQNDALWYMVAAFVLWYWSMVTMA
jgi:hypothetical protein